MVVMENEFRRRLDHWIRVLTEDLYHPIQKLSFQAFTTMEELSPEEALAGPFTTVEMPFTWGREWEYCWLKDRFTLPAEAEGKRVVLDLSLSGEATVFVNGKAFGTYRADWVECPYIYIEDNILTPSGVPGETYDILVEAYAGHYISRGKNTSGCSTGPVLPGTCEPPAENGARAQVKEPTVGIWNEEAYQLLMDVKTLKILMDTVESDSLRAAELAEGLEKFTMTVDFEKPLAERLRTYRAAREILKPLLLAENGSTAPVFYTVGNSHLDLAWLWPMQETYRKPARTFAAQLRHIEAYPEYRFIQSQPASYEMCRQYYPELFERIKEAIKGGQWIADGAMWVEPDTNMAGGEALIRQLLYGIRYYKEVLGVESLVLWLPDSFGYSGVLPQLLKKSGVKYLVTQKIFWSYNEGERFPYHYFKWEGIDGSEVTAFLPTDYTYFTDPGSLTKVWKERRQARDLKGFLIPFGYGDGGGGPSRDHIEYLMREKDLEGMPRTKMVSPREFFEEMEESGGPKNTYRGELYFNAHRGTYTSQAAIKRNNRKCEIALRDMEILGSLAMLRGTPWDPSAAERLWKELLLHQFHDILPGSSIARVYEEAVPRVGKVIAEADERAEKSAEALVRIAGRQTSGDAGVTVFNTLSFPRTGLVELPDAFRYGAETTEGAPVPVDITDGRVEALVTVPPMGTVAIIPARAENARNAGDAASAARAIASEDGFVLENNLIRAVLNASGEVISYVRKDTGREFAAGPMNRFRLYKDVPRLYDAWDIDSNYIDQEITGAVSASCEIVKASGLTTRILRKGRVGNSDFSQEIILTAGSERILFRTKVEWRELHRLLKVSFPSDVYTNEGINEIQFGYVKRPVHRSRVYDRDRFEVCNHRYSVLADESHGAAVLNDCKYGISMNENCLELTLLKAAAAPAMRADNGTQEFTYAFMGFESSFRDSGVVRRGLDLNAPLRVSGGLLDMESMVSVDRDNVILETMKPAEDGSGDLILRFYEALGASGKAKISLGFGKRVFSCDLLEKEERELPLENGTVTLSFGVFEVLTLRVRL